MEGTWSSAFNFLFYFCSKLCSLGRLRDRFLACRRFIRVQLESSSSVEDNWCMQDWAKGKNKVVLQPHQKLQVTPISKDGVTFQSCFGGGGEEGCKREEEVLGPLQAHTDDVGSGKGACAWPWERNMSSIEVISEESWWLEAYLSWSNPPLSSWVIRTLFLKEDVGKTLQCSSQVESGKRVIVSLSCNIVCRADTISCLAKIQLL